MSFAPYQSEEDKLDRYLNGFATQSFRDQADRDYIAASPLAGWIKDFHLQVVSIATTAIETAPVTAPGTPTKKSPPFGGLLVSSTRLLRRRIALLDRGIGMTLRVVLGHEAAGFCAAKIWRRTLLFVTHSSSLLVVGYKPTGTSC